MDGIFEIFAGDDRDHRPEDFFLSDAHFGIDINKYGWLHEPAVLVIARIQPIASTLQLCAFGLSDFHVLEI